MSVVLAYALDDSMQVVHASTAPREQQYTCLECGTGLILKRGEKISPHFAHATSIACTGEGVVHRAAKHILAERLLQSLQRTDGINWLEPCQNLNCLEVGLPVVQQVWQIDNWQGVIEEAPYKTRRLDVAILSKQGEVLVGFEVLDRHAVDDEKALELDIPWFEITAQSILEQRPWDIRNGVKPLPARVCWRCRERQRLNEQNKNFEEIRQSVEEAFIAEGKAHIERWFSIIRLAREIAAKQREGREKSKPMPQTSRAKSTLTKDSIEDREKIRLEFLEMQLNGKLYSYFRQGQGKIHIEVLNGIAYRVYPNGKQVQIQSSHWRFDLAREISEFQKDHHLLLMIFPEGKRLLTAWTRVQQIGT